MRRRPVFTGAALDRAEPQRKDPGWVREMTESPSARALAVSGDGVVLDGGDPPALARRPLSASERREPILLGLEAGAPLFATPAADTAGATSLRDAGVVLSASEGGLAAYALALMSWHRRSRFCANCGALTEVAEAGIARSCPSCGTTHFPQMDPVVIMLVEDPAGRVLLGRREGWPPGRFSALAGFVSPGESVEEAVVREVREESGIQARDPVFVASQPWPFPSSLMLGFHASGDGAEPSAEDGELEAVRWFTRDQLLAARDRDEEHGQAGALRLPPEVAIARLLIERWLERGG